MNMIAGMEEPTEGRILFGDRDMAGVPMGRRGVGFVFQNYAIFTHMTVRQNLAYGPRMHGAPTSRDRPARRRDRRTAAADAAARPQGRPAFRQHPAARRDRPLGDHGAGDLPAGRAAVQCRRRLPRGDAHRAQAPAAPVQADHGLRHARPARGDDHGRPHRRDGSWRAAAGRHAARGLQQSGQRLRRPLHRRAWHEPACGHARPKATAGWSSISVRWAPRRRCRTGWRSAARRNRGDVLLRLPSGTGDDRRRGSRASLRR